MQRDKVYLVGFMGAGKSSLARALGRQLGWRVDDIDDLIEARERRSIADIFAARGEPYFRAVEREVLRALLLPRHVVVATGGGTFVDPENRAAINADGMSVWLDVRFETVVDRVPSDGRRPLAANREGMRALFEARRLAYRQAHLRVDASSAGLDELVERVLDRMGW